MRAPLVYLDHNAAAPLLPAVRAALSEALDAGLGNPSSVHWAGQRARAAVERAREQVAAAIGARPEEIVFTSGATEANALAWHGVAADAAVLTSRVEHPSVMALARRRRESGCVVRWAGADTHGAPVAPQSLDAQGPVAFLSVIAANNELGVLTDLAAWRALAAAWGARLHIDATQALGRVQVDVRAWGAATAAFSAAKVGGPAGTGALYVRTGVPLEPLIIGHQEGGRRGGSENVLGMVGFGAACAHAADRLAAAASVRQLRDRLWAGLRAAVPGCDRNGAAPPVVETGQTLNVSFADVDGSRLQRALDVEGVCVATGAACASGTVEPSHVLLALPGVGADVARRARSAIRLSLGLETTPAEVERAVEVIALVVKRMRAQG